MKVLVLGGTVFLGFHIVEAALERGHEVTIFNRGRHGDDSLPALVERLRGDRHTDLGALRGRSWDAVFDTCGYLPSAVQASSSLLAGSAGHYTFISSCSVYAYLSPGRIDEDSPVAELSESELEEAEAIRPERSFFIAPEYGAKYGALKALCERAASYSMPGRVLNVRAGLVVGPRDYADRFPYWVARTARGGDVLAPGRPDRRVRVIDARDLAAWCLLMAEEGRAGTFNATGADGLTMKGMLEECRAASGSDARFRWVGEESLLEQGVRAWSELPLWIPDERNGIFDIVNDRAVALGLRFRPLAATVRETLDWLGTRPPDHAWVAGMSPERESELLRLWATHGA